MNNLKVEIEMRNIDKIKNMTLDEMAEWFMNRYTVCELNKPCIECKYNGWCSSETKEDFKKWLLSTKN